MLGYIGNKLLLFQAIRDILHENVASTSGQQEMHVIPVGDSSTSMQLWIL